MHACMYVCMYVCMYIDFKPYSWLPELLPRQSEFGEYWKILEVRGPSQSPTYSDLPKLGKKESTLNYGRVHPYYDVIYNNIFLNYGILASLGNQIR